MRFRTELLIMTDRERLLNRLETYGIRPEYSLGQNFLWDRALIEKMLEKSSALPLVNVLEIGAGAASMSEILARHAQKLVAIEIDERLFPLLRRCEETYSSLTFIPGDACKMDFASFFTAEEKKDLQVIANLPYYLTSDLIKKCVLELPEADRFIFLVQDDAVPRLKGAAGDGKSKSKNQGALAKLLSCYGEVKSLFKVPARAFYPEPRVDSRFISVEARDRGEASRLLREKPEALAYVIEQAFSQRRKTLLNCFPEKATKEKIKVWLNREKMAENIRAEQLSAKDFASLTRALCL